MIELYHSEQCPFCVKVRLFLEAEGIAYVSKPVPMGRTSPIKEELRKLGGKTQVPFLNDSDKGVMMYESDDIIDYVRENYVKQPR